MIDLKQFEGHTPGPWTDDICTFGPNKKPIMVCTDYAKKFGEGNPEARANARLIAAAPELLSENARLRAELEKAKGALQQYVVIDRCENPIRTPLPNPMGYASHEALSNCGECRYCKALAALAPAASGEKEEQNE